MRNDKAWDYMGADFWQAEDNKVSSTHHSIYSIVLAFLLYIKDPYGAGVVVNVFLFTDLSPLAGSKAALLTQIWDTVLVRGILTYFVDRDMLMGRHKVVLVAGCYISLKQMEAWAMFYSVLLGAAIIQPMVL